MSVLSIRYSYFIFFRPIFATMGNTSKRIIGVTAGILVTIMAGLVFYRSVNVGNPNYKLLIMSCGMAFFLLFLVFSKNISKRNRK